MTAGVFTNLLNYLLFYMKVITTLSQFVRLNVQTCYAYRIIYSLEPTLRYNPFDTMRGVPPSVKDRPVPAEEYISSASEASSEEDERFDTEYRKT